MTRVTCGLESLHSFLPAPAASPQPLATKKVYPQTREPIAVSFDVRFSVHRTLTEWFWRVEIERLRRTLTPRRTSISMFFSVPPASCGWWPFFWRLTPLVVHFICGMYNVFCLAFHRLRGGRFPHPTAQARG